MSKRFGLEIKRARKGAGLTQEQAAEALNVSVRTYAKYESGEILPGDDMVAGMMQVFENPCLGYAYLSNFQQKLRTLRAFEEALREADKHFYLRLMNDETVEIIDLLSGSKRYVNIACDNAAAMMYDIFRQAGDWIL